jgi:hypothetical protein
LIPQNSGIGSRIPKYLTPPSPCDPSISISGKFLLRFLLAILNTLASALLIVSLGASQIVKSSNPEKMDDGFVVADRPTERRSSHFHLIHWIRHNHNSTIGCGKAKTILYYDQCSVIQFTKQKPNINDKFSSCTHVVALL